MHRNGMFFRWQITDATKHQGPQLKKAAIRQFLPNKNKTENATALQNLSKCTPGFWEYLGIRTNGSRVFWNRNL